MTPSATRPVFDPVKDQRYPAVIMPIGPPASGKTTLYRSINPLTTEAGITLARISRDDLRYTLLGSATNFRHEPRITSHVHALIARHLRAGSSVYLDETNTIAEFRTALIRHVRSAHPAVALVAYLRSSDLGWIDFTERDRERSASAGSHRVPSTTMGRQVDIWRKCTAKRLAAQFDFVALFDDAGLFFPPAARPIPKST